MRLILLKITALFIGLMVVFVLLEVVYRLKLRFTKSDNIEFVLANKIFKYSDNPSLLVEMRPNVTAVKDNLVFKTNRFGYRDDEWTTDTTKKRILLISDSVGFPFGLNHEDGYEYKLEQILKQKYNIDIEILNISCLGYNALQYIENINRFDSIAGKTIHYDYILQNVTQNDHQPTGKPSPLVWIDAPNSPYRWIPSKLVKRGIEFYYRNNVQPKLYSEKYLYRLFDFLKVKQSAGNKVLVFTIPELNTENSKYISQLIDYNKSNTKLNYVFLNDDFNSIAKENRKSLYYTNDNMHLSAKGHELVAEALAKIIYKNFKSI